jgi:hypothetical protein
MEEGTGIQNSRCTTPIFFFVKECNPVIHHAQGAGVWSKSDYRTKTALRQIQCSFMGSRCTSIEISGGILLSSDPHSSKQTEWSIHPRNKYSKFDSTLHPTNR